MFCASKPVLHRLRLELSAFGAGRLAGALTFLVLGSTLFICPGLALAGASPDRTGKVSWAGDFRARLEQDFDSRRADGREREDRLRLRVRLRLGLSWQATETLSAGARLRSGSDENHQSPHITLVDLDGNDTGEADFNLDKWYLRAGTEDRWVWLGRNSFPFWKPSDLFWDDDVTPAGIAGGVSRSVGDAGKLDLRLAYLAMPVGMRDFSGNLGGIQASYFGRRATLAAALLDFDSTPSDADAPILRKGNGLRDYRIWVVNLHGRRDNGRRPLTFGVDLAHNDSSYTEADGFAFANRDQTNAYAASVAWGQPGSRGEWQVGLTWAHIETLAVNASYAGDDWIRWGSSRETDASDYEGFELRYARGLARGRNLVVRLFLVEAITSPQDGNRFRLDYNLRF